MRVRASRSWARPAPRSEFFYLIGRAADRPPPSTTKYSQAFIGVPGGALDLGGTRAIGTSAMADDGVPRFAEIP